MSECKGRFYLIKKTHPGIIFPDRADASRSRLGGRGREPPSVLERAPQGTACISPRGRRGSQGQRGKLGRRRRARRWQASRAQHARESRPGQIFFFGQSGTMGRVQGYTIPYSRYPNSGIYTVLLWPKIGYSYISAFDMRPGQHLIGWVDRFFYVCCYNYRTYISCTHIFDHMHQVVTGSGGNTIDLALLSTGINEEYIKVAVPLKHSTKALNTASNSRKILPRTPHIPKLLPPTN